MNKSSKQKKEILKQKRETLRAEKEARRLEKLAAEGRLIHGEEAPAGAVPADFSEQAPNNSYSPPPYYLDVEFTCVGCGVSEVWTAEQQKWYYEVAKGSIYAMAVRCRECRKKQRAEKEE